MRVRTFVEIDITDVEFPTLPVIEPESGGEESLSFLLVISSGVPGGSTDRAVVTSHDDGDTWVNRTTPAGIGYSAAAVSIARGECLLLGQSGDMLVTSDGETFTTVANDIGVNGSWRDLIRVDALGLYIAIGQDATDTTHRVATSPDGVTWTRRTISSKAWSRLFYNQYTNRVTAGVGSVLSTQPVAHTSDGITWTDIPAMGFSSDAAEMTQTSSGRYVWGARAETSTIHTDNLTSFTQTGGLVGGQLAISYDPSLNLLATSAASSIFSSPPSSIAWTSRATGGSDQWRAESLCSVSFGGFIGLSPIAAGLTTHRIIRSTDGISWSNTAPVQLFTDSSYHQIYEVVL